MLETIREFAVEQLAASGEEENTRQAHASFFLTFAEQQSSLPFLPNDTGKLLHIEAEHANLRAALVWLEANGETSDFARLAIALSLFWMVRGYLREGRAWLDHALASDPALPASDQIKLRIVLGLTAMMQNDLQLPAQILAESLAIARASGDTLGETQALIALGVLATLEGALEQAAHLLEEAVSQARSLTDKRMATALASAALANLGVVAHERGHLDAATTYHEAALAGQRTVGDVRGAWLSLIDLGNVTLSQGDNARAASFYRQGLAMARESGDRRPTAETLEGIGRAEVSTRPAYAGLLFAAAERLRETTGIIARGVFHQTLYETGVTAVRETLGDEKFAVAWAAGRALSIEQAIAEALSPPETLVSPTRDLFTEREIEILHLLVVGHPNRAIADTLFLNVRTVENHVAHILAKLGVRTRTAAATAAIANGIVAADTSPPA